MGLRDKKQERTIYNKGRRHYLITAIQILIAKSEATTPAKAHLGGELKFKRTKSLERLYKELRALS